MPAEAKPDHIFVLVHGLADTFHAWDNCIKELRKWGSPDVMFYASAVNARFRTHDGFDKCGERLAQEIREIVGQHPQLTKLSIIGHSMGGMIARYAMGILYHPSDGTICGLMPVHYITLATPHLGLTADDGPAQVPFMGWAGEIPLLGRQVKSALQSVARGVARTMFRDTGRHFLALDGRGGELPVLMMLAMDLPDRGQYFFSALAAFASRACYGNVGGDHWVSWANATLRATEDLPPILPDIVRHGRGVVREDPPEAGIGSSSSGPEPDNSGGNGGAGGGEGGGQGVIPGAAQLRDVVALVERERESPRQVVTFALERLRRLAWRRLDVSFAGALMGTAHNNIQATRWTNRVGFSVLEHLRGHLQAVEGLLAAPGEGGSGGRGNRDTGGD